jgi:NADP-dependent 3-hydroxy acid dehydrogenase YdfG
MFTTVPHSLCNTLLDVKADEGSVAVIAQMPTYPDLAAKLAVVTGGSWVIGAATCRLLIESGTKVAVNAWDGGWAIEIDADVADFAAAENTQPQVEEGYGPVEVLVTFVGDHGYYRLTEQVGGEVG